LSGYEINVIINEKMLLIAHSYPEWAIFFCQLCFRDIHAKVQGEKQFPSDISQSVAKDIKEGKIKSGVPIFLLE